MSGVIFTGVSEGFWKSADTSASIPCSQARRPRAKIGASAIPTDESREVAWLLPGCCCRGAPRSPSIDEPQFIGWLARTQGHVIDAIPVLGGDTVVSVPIETITAEGAPCPDPKDIVLARSEL